MTAIVSSKLGLLEPYFSLWIIEESPRRKREKEREGVVRRKKKKKRLRKIFGEKKFARQKLKRTSGYSKSFLKYVYLKNSRERFVG